MAECLELLESARKGIEVKLAAGAKNAKRLYEKEVVPTLEELDRVADDLLLATDPHGQATRAPRQREREVRSALDRHALACSRLLELIDELDTYSFTDPIRIAEADLRVH